MPFMTIKNIAVILALVAVLGVFMMKSSPESSDSDKTGSLFANLNFSATSAIPSLGDSFNTTSAWAIFEDYLKAAKAHDLEGIKSLSYKLSETCQNPASREECYGLMDGVYALANNFKLGDFKNTSYDSKQIIMSTDYLNGDINNLSVKTVLYFIKTKNGEPKVLGIRFCYGADSENYQCVNTDPEKRDSDKDGWWDDIEALKGE